MHYSKLTTDVSGESQANSEQVEPREASEGNAALEEKIRLRAHEIYLERGEQSGSESDDWLRAEHELKRST
jgi:hypothetical protein